MRNEMIRVREEATRDRPPKGGEALVAYFHRRDGAERQRVMTLAPHEFIRRFLLHVLPNGFHRIRHYGLLASSARKANSTRARQLLAVAPPPEPVTVARTTRLAPALPLLRRAHDHHRDLRTMEPAPRATSRARTPMAGSTSW